MADPRFMAEGAKKRRHTAVLAFQSPDGYGHLGELLGFVALPTHNLRFNLPVVPPHTSALRNRIQERLGVVVQVQSRTTPPFYNFKGDLVFVRSVRPGSLQLLNNERHRSDAPKVSL
jgi:hypothetical protein